MAVKSFTADEKAEALQLLKDGHSRKEVADQMGCSIASLQLWKRSAGGKKKGKKKKTAKSTKKGAVASASACQCGCGCECCCCVSFEEFAHGYWSKAPHAGEVLKLPPDMMPEAVKYINNVLKYAHDHLGCGK